MKSLLLVSVALAAVGASGAYAQDAAPASAAAAEEPELKFDIMEFEVAGNSVLGAAAIQNALTPFTGYAKQVADVEGSRAALENAYRSAGYATVVVEVPPQDVRSGIVRLSVVEGKVDQVRVKGARFVLPSEIKAALPGLVEGSVPNVPEMQRELSDANSRTTRTITPEFRAGQAPGTVDVDLVVEDKRPWGASVEVNDQFNRSTERLRANASISYANLWQRGHSANLFFQTAPKKVDQIQVWSGSYYAPLGYSRTSLLGYAVHSNTDVATIGGLAVLGQGTTVGGRIIHTLDGSPKGVVQSLMLGVDFKDYMDQIGLTDPATGKPLTFDTPVTYLPFTTQYRLMRGDRNSNFEFSIGATFALEGLVGKQEQFGGIVDIDPQTPGNQGQPGKRADSEASFAFLSGSTSYAQRFGVWDSKVSFDWQAATAPLISNEQFVLGGVGTIRGFREAEVLGDSGVRLSAEFGRSFKFETLGDVRLAAFVEVGGAFLNRPLPEEKSEIWLGSAGLSTTFEIYEALYGQFDLAYRFRDDPAGSGSPQPEDVGDLRAHVKLGLKY